MAQSANIAKVSPVHQRLADWLIADGGGKGWGERAALQFNYTRAWISTIYHSDAFQDYYQTRASEHAAVLSVSVADKVNGVAGQALDALGKRLEVEGDSLPVGQILQIADVTLARIAQAKAASQPAQQNNVFLVSRDELEASRDRMRSAPKQLELKAGPERETAGGASGNSDGGKT